jgi:hypothetical protein
MARRSWHASPVFLHGARTLVPLGIVSGCAVAAALGMLLFYYQPAQQQLDAAREGYETARQTHQRFKTARTTYEELQQVWRMFPARAEFAGLVLHISDTAQQDNVAIPGMMYSFQKPDGALAQQAAMTFRAAAAYEAIRRFIHRLETADSYLVVESLDASRSSKTTNLVEFNVRVVTFLRPDKAARGQDHD